jgi:soluble lytic murein transglycosylase
VNPRIVPIVFASCLLTLTTGTRDLIPTTGGSWIDPVPAHAFVAEMPAEVPMNAWLSARAAIQSGDGAAAERHLSLALEERPVLAPYIRRLEAEARLLQADTAGAIERLRAAAAPGRALASRTTMRLAELEHASGRFVEAAGTWERLRRIVAGADERRAAVEQAVSLAASGDSAAARRLLLEVLRSPAHPLVGASAATQLLAITPQPDAAFAFRVAGVFYEAGDFPRAATWFEKALSGGAARGRGEILMQIGRSYERADEFRTAIGAFKRVLREGNGVSSSLVKYRIGLCHQRLGEDAEGEKWFEQVLAESPRSSFADDILYRMATRRDRKERRADALALYRRLVAQYPRSQWADESAWKIGLAALEDGQPRAAEQAFASALRRFPRSDYAPAMAYWRGKVLEGEGRKADALAQYASILRNTSDAYYRGRSSVAFQRLGGLFTEADLEAARARATRGELVEALADLRAIRDAAPGEISDRARAEARNVMTRIGYWSDIARFSDALVDSPALFFDLGERNDPRIPEIEALLAVGAYDEAAQEMVAIRVDAGPRPERRFAMIRILAEGGFYRQAMREVESLVRELGGPRDPAAMPWIASQFLYPRFYGPFVREEAVKNGIDDRFVLAVIREESRFQADVASWAGAQGLMQIMPATGERLSRQMGLESYRREMLHDPKMNIRMGTFFLKHLLGLYDGKRHLALAGYNAGPGNANRWIRQNPGIEEDFLIEKISFRETRNYVKRVLGTYWTYRLIDGDPIGQL